MQQFSLSQSEFTSNFLLFWQKKTYMKIRFVRKTEKYRLTWFSRITIILVLLFGFIFILRNLDAFLSVSKPIKSKVLVLEGWLPDYAVKELMKEYYDNDYEHLIITGIPTHKGYYVTQFNTSSEIAKKTLYMFGFDTTGIAMVTIPQSIQMDRTYTTAIALELYLTENLPEVNKINVFTLGSHARRSRLLFKRALEPEIEVGIISADNHEYNKDKWWNSSRGFRTVTNEAIGYFYVKLFFHPDKKKVQSLLRKGKYIDYINRIRYQKDQEFFDSLHSPLTEKQISKFTGLKYFPPDLQYKAKAKFMVDTASVFKMKTTTDRLPEYRQYGTLTFTIHTDTFHLTTYQNIELSKREEHKDYLFLPFRDMTNGKETYGGGRFLDFEIPETDSAFIDFNLCYNPYCAYNPRYSCPIPPPENTLGIEIRAGEKEYEKH